VLTDTYARENASLFIHLADETLSQKSFFSFAANVLRSSRLRGQRRLVFIFEENWVEQHMTEAAELINSLHNIHCGACLTHAGITDQTDMILARIPFDYVRLNPELTANLGGEREKQLTNVIKAAQAVGAQVIATQVEDSKNLSTLWLMGVRLFQGFLLQSPDQAIHSQNDMEFIKQFFTPRA
jgi:multidomain signaling protein FimX